MTLTREQVQRELDSLPARYKTADVDRLIRSWVRQKADVSALRPYILSQQQFHRIYFYVSLDQIKNVDERMAFIHQNLLFSDWWHTDQIIRYVAKLDFDTALRYAKDYVRSADPFIRRWGYVLFISKLCIGHAEALLKLTHGDDHYSVQMAQGWLIAELAVHEPETVYQWFRQNNLDYSINGKAIQKICDSFRISDEWKVKFKALRPSLRTPQKMKTVKITAIRKTSYPDLMAQYENPIEHTCDVLEGMVWISTDGQKPEGLCPSAWESMASFVTALAKGGGNFYDGWMKNPYSAMISCNDGFRPVSFYIEVI